MLYLHSICLLFALLGLVLSGAHTLVVIGWSNHLYNPIFVFAAKRLVILHPGSLCDIPRSKVERLEVPTPEVWMAWILHFWLCPSSWYEQLLLSHLMLSTLCALCAAIVISLRVNFCSTPPLDVIYVNYIGAEVVKPLLFCFWACGGFHLVHITGCLWWSRIGYSQLA